jgi:3-methyladenine DNA glycosylase/8-oxoguanine DNA glycosylase
VGNERVRLNEVEVKKEALMEKIENEIDLKTVLDHENRLANDEVEFYTLEETKKLLDI